MFYLYEISHFLAFLCPALTFYIFCLPDYLPKIIHYWPALGGVSRKSRKKFDTPVFRSSLDDVTRKGCLRMRTPLKSDFPLFLRSINRNQAVMLMWKNKSSNEGKNCLIIECMFLARGTTDPGHCVWNWVISGNSKVVKNYPTIRQQTFKHCQRHNGPRVLNP